MATGAASGAEWRRHRDEFHHGSPTPDPRDVAAKAVRTRDIYIRDLHLDTIKVKTRDFR